MLRQQRRAPDLDARKGAQGQIAHRWRECPSAAAYHLIALRGPTDNQPNLNRNVQPNSPKAKPHHRSLPKVVLLKDIMAALEASGAE